MPSVPKQLLQSAEIVVDGKTGEVRQAGADRTGAFIAKFKHDAERNLYLFAKTVMGFDLLNMSLHRWFCDTLCALPPSNDPNASYRKLILMPRGHLKTTVMKALAVHLLLQPTEHNIYFPNGIGSLPHSQGTSTRIMLASKTSKLSCSTLSEIMQIFETNQLLKALWPNCVWENPAKQASKWNAERIVLPRKDIFKEASIETIGTGGQITGYHFNVHLLDDLIDIEDANSPTTMQTAIEWFYASRALMDDPDKSLEFTTGTRWAVNDLYQHIEENDDSVAMIKRAVIEDGECIFPERYTPETCQRLQRELGVMFPLLYMNSAADPELTDFDMSRVRHFTIEGDRIVFSEDERDLLMRERTQVAQEFASKAMPKLDRSKPLGAQWDVLAAREDYIRTRHVRSS